jgi:hypothetical protein
MNSNSNKKLKIVFCTTCKNRAFHLERTLPQNLADNPTATFVVLNYGSEDNLLDILQPYLKSGRLIVYNYNTTEPFRMAHAKNMVHRLGILEQADVLVNVDADNFLGSGFENFVAETFQRNKNAFLWSGVVKGLGRRLRGVSGRIAVTPAAFLKAGGYDEKYDTWGPDDKDFTSRLIYLGYKPIEIDRCYLDCIPHGAGLRFREYPHIQENINVETDELPPLKSAVVNFGNVGVGEVSQLDGSSFQISPIPTRIFGIGLHKTATTSLHTALQLLGYESAHWNSGVWARDIWNEIRTFSVSPTIEKTYAASDLPISILYKELDHAYAGSKFILTIRDEIEWLRSVQNHFTYKNPHRWEWDAYPFSNKIHKIIYGCKGFDAVVFLKRYRKHNTDVMDYFKDRPDDLLVIKIPRWEELCNFLRKPIPKIAYPWKLATKYTL